MLNVVLVRPLPLIVSHVSILEQMRPFWMEVHALKLQTALLEPLLIHQLIFVNHAMSQIANLAQM